MGRVLTAVAVIVLANVVLDYYSNSGLRKKVLGR